MLIGDSQGSMYGYALASLAHRLDFRLNILSVKAGSALPGEAHTRWPSISRFLGERKPDVLIVAQAWSARFGEGGDGDFRNAMAVVADRADKIIVMTQPPLAPANATRQAIRAGARPPFFEDAAAREQRVRARAIIGNVAGDRVEVLDVADLFWAPTAPSGLSLRTACWHFKTADISRRRERRWSGQGSSKR